MDWDHAKPIDYRFASDKYGYPQVYRDGVPVGESFVIGGSQRTRRQRRNESRGNGPVVVWVFMLVPPGYTDSSMVVQVSLDNTGAVRGCYFDPLADASESAQGALDKETQLVAWKIGGQKPLLLQTGLSSLAKDQATCWRTSTTAGRGSGP